MSINMRCNCPYIICDFHGDCVRCVKHNREVGELAHCMEESAVRMGAALPLKLPNTVLTDDAEAMSRKSAEMIADTVRKRADALISLPAGSTAKRTFQILCEMKQKGEVDFSRAKFVSLDEWLDLADESENCDAFMRANFYEPAGIDESQITRFNVHAADLQAECKRVDQAIFDHGGIDCVLLGIGMNGHLGLNEPGGDFSDYAKVVQLSETTMQVGQKYFSDGMALSRGITLGVHHFFNAHKVVLQVCGAHKADIMYDLYHTAPTEQLPATVLKLLPQGVIVTDRSAAARILDLI